VIPVKDGNPVYKSSVRIFDSQGKPIMQFEKPGWQIQAMGISPDGKNIGVSFYQWTDSPKSEVQFNTLILEESGKIIFQIPVGFQNLIFNDDKSRLILIDKNSCHLFDLLKNQQIGSYSTQENNSLFLAAVFLSPSEAIILQEGKPGPGIPGSRTPWKYETIYIRTLSEEGEELNPLLIENITLFNPSLHYNKDNQTLFIGHSTGWKLYKVEK
jgi:WD40 repeat protein